MAVLTIYLSIENGIKRQETRRRRRRRRRPRRKCIRVGQLFISEKQREGAGFEKRLMSGVRSADETLSMLSDHCCNQGIDGADISLLSVMILICLFTLLFTCLWPTKKVTRKYEERRRFPVALCSTAIVNFYLSSVNFCRNVSQVLHHLCPTTLVVIFFFFPYFLFFSMCL